MLVRVEVHAYGPRCYLLGRRIHHWHWGIALIAAGTYLVATDRRDLPRRQARRRT